jgi:hypothetical protein
MRTGLGDEDDCLQKNGSSRIPPFGSCSCALCFAGRLEVGRSVDSSSARSLPTLRRAILFPSERFSLAQPHRLKRLAALDTLR